MYVKPAFCATGRGWADAGMADCAAGAASPAEAELKVDSGSGAASPAGAAGRDARGARCCSSLMVSGRPAMKMDTMSVGDGRTARGSEIKKAFLSLEKLVSGDPTAGSGT